MIGASNVKSSVQLRVKIKTKCQNVTGKMNAVGSKGCITNSSNLNFLWVTPNARLIGKNCVCRQIENIYFKKVSPKQFRVQSSSNAVYVSTNNCCQKFCAGWSKSGNYLRQRVIQFQLDAVFLFMTKHNVVKALQFNTYKIPLTLS